jgi:hypothetical protein
MPLVPKSFPESFKKINQTKRSFAGVWMIVAFSLPHPVCSMGGLLEEKFNKGWGFSSSKAFGVTFADTIHRI